MRFAGKIIRRGKLFMWEVFVGEYYSPGKIFVTKPKFCLFTPTKNGTGMTFYSKDKKSIHNNSILSTENISTDESNLPINDKLSSLEASSSIVPTSPEINEWKDAPKRKRVRRENLHNEIEETSIISPNPFRYLVQDDQSSFEDEVVTNNIIHKKISMINSSRNVNKRPEVVTQVNPENDKLLNNINMKTRRGKLSYSLMSKQGKK